MTLGEALAALDAQKPNDRTDAEKIAWLSRLDHHAYNDVMRVHTPVPPAFPGYTADTPRTAVLLAEEPFADMYLLYMSAEIDFLNGDYTRYNNASAYFNRVFADWANDYHAKHLPQTGVCIQLL